MDGSMPCALRRGMWDVTGEARQRGAWDATARAWDVMGRVCGMGEAQWQEFKS